MHKESIIVNSLYCVLNAVTGGLVEVKTYLLDYKINFIDLLISSLDYLYKQKTNNYDIMIEIIQGMKLFVRYEDDLVNSNITERLINNSSPSVIDLLDIMIFDNRDKFLVLHANELINIIENRFNEILQDKSTNKLNNELNVKLKIYLYYQIS